MSKPRDPVIAVLKYFQEADLALAQQALSLAQQVVRARIPKSGQTRPKAVAKPKPVAEAATAS